MNPDELEAIGLGLPKEVVRLARAERAWTAAAESLAERIRGALGSDVQAIEHIGSTSVPGLLAKPIVDLAAQLAPGAPNDVAIERLETAGWEYRGDAGDQGGLVFVLSVRPLYRVAHLHLLCHEDVQWRHYLALRDRLRTDAAARTEYEQVKTELAAAFAGDPVAYTNGKDDVVRRLRSRS